MDERIEEVTLINRVSPVQKLTLARPRKDRRELMYQLTRYPKAQKPKTIKQVKNKNAIDTLSPGPSKDLNSNDFTEDFKKRIAFDRAMIIGDWDK